MYLKHNYPFSKQSDYEFEISHRIETESKKSHCTHVHLLVAHTLPESSSQTPRKRKAAVILLTISPW